MDAPQTAEDAKALLKRFAKHVAIKTRFIELLLAGRDGKPVGDEVKIGDYWSVEESNRLFAHACQAEGVAEGVAESYATEMETANRAQLTLYLKKAGRMIGLTRAGLQKLEEAVAGM